MDLIPQILTLSADWFNRVVASIEFISPTEAQIVLILLTVEFLLDFYVRFFEVKLNP